MICTNRANIMNALHRLIFLFCYFLTNEIVKSEDSCGDGLVPLEVSIYTDFYPGDTSWRIFDTADSSDIMSGGNYTNRWTQHNKRTCFDLMGCFEFTVFDWYGDGFNDTEAFARVSLVDSLIFDVQGNFGLSQSSMRFGFLCPSSVPSSVPSISPSISLSPSSVPSTSLVPTASPTSSSYPTDQGITNINHHSIDNVKCVGKITNDTFVPSVTCSASKLVGTKAVMEMKQGNCTGTKLGTMENINDDTITVMSGSVDNYINDTDQAFVFCLVVQTFIGNQTEVITEGKTEGTVILNRDLSGEFSLEVSMEGYTTEITSLDDVKGNSVALRAYQCKNDYSKILNPTEKAQGSTLSVCIVTDQGTSVSLTGVSIEISPFTTDSFTVTPIVTSDIATNDVLTKFNSFTDGSKVQVKTVLVSKYFADTSNTIVVSGTANYNYSSERERRLRVLQSIDDEDISPFDLKIDLKANEAGIFQLSSSTAYNLFHVYGMSALMTCVVTFFI